MSRNWLVVRLAKCSYVLGDRWAICEVVGLFVRYGGYLRMIGAFLSEM